MVLSLSMRETAPCGLDSAPPDAAGWRRSTPPLSGAREFCRAAIARNGAARGKFLLNDAGASRHGPRRQVARQGEAAWMRRSFPKGICQRPDGSTERPAKEKASNTRA